MSSYESPCLNRFKRHELDPDAVPTQTEGMSDIDWLDKNGLDHNSEPCDYFVAFLPDELIDKWSMYTNTKAMSKCREKTRRTSLL